ncbi:MAG TPA: hypothetical protein VMM15_04150 [Bradyrhizobium sp.]|nr:hypothetical protein [Bradyrhizobium sp.]
MKRKLNVPDDLRRALHYVRRAVEIALFTHTPCPSAVVAEALARERAEEPDRAVGKPADVGHAPDASRAAP